jgi:hypothetical protein
VLIPAFFRQSNPNMDMQDEGDDHKAFSKVPFIVSAECEVGGYFNCYDTVTTLSGEIFNDLGLLYGMGNNGLISLTSTKDYWGSEIDPFYPFTNTLNAVNYFGLAATMGDGMRSIFNAYGICGPPSNENYVLIGAGTLKAAPYIPYGMQMQQLSGGNIENTDTCNYSGQLIWLQNFNVASTGNFTAIGKEIRIYAESDLKGEADIKASD